MPRGRPRKDGENGAAAPIQAPKINGNGANLGFEGQLFLAADKLRKNLEPSDYKHVALGLIFLKHISNAFEAKRGDLLAEDPATAEDPDEYLAENVFWVLDRRHRIVDELADRRLLGVGLQMRPARPLGHRTTPASRACCRRTITDRRSTPDQVRDRIERLVPGPYVELFARETKPGWDCWGNQPELFDQGPSNTRRQPSRLVGQSSLYV
jgi:hypothetical protein